jgi:hypothetical protein
LIIIYHMLKEDKPYEERDDDLANRKLRMMEQKGNRSNKRSDKLGTLEGKGKEIFIREVSIVDAG